MRGCQGNDRCGQRGLSLIELIVALGIGLFLIVGALTVYAQSRSTYGINESIARLQENGRYFFDVVEPDIRMAGYAGCVNVNQALNASANYTATNGLNNATDFANAFAPQVHIQGYEWTSAGTWTPALPAP